MTPPRRVQRFRSVEEMSAADLTPAEGDFDRFLRHCARYHALAPRRFKPGVFKFRSIAEAQQARESHPHVIDTGRLET